jgi:hypothetical protein
LFPGDLCGIEDEGGINSLDDDVDGDIRLHIDGVSIDVMASSRRSFRDLFRAVPNNLRNSYDINVNICIIQSSKYTASEQITVSLDIRVVGYSEMVVHGIARIK